MILDDKTLSVLVVDDNQAFHHLVSAHLEQIKSFKRAVELDFAQDGKEAIEKLDQKDFALVILDWEMPVLGQGEVLRYLRKHHRLIPVVVISGVEHHHIADELKALKAAFLSKDQMKPETLHHAISVALALLNFNPSLFFERWD